MQIHSCSKQAYFPETVLYEKYFVQFERIVFSKQEIKNVLMLISS